MERLHYDEVYIKVGSCVWAENFKLMSEQRHKNDIVQCGICVSTQHMPYDRGKPRNTLIDLAGCRKVGLTLTSS
jgi:hypothetical protein